MSASHENNVAISDDMGTRFEPVKGLAQSSIDSVGYGEASHLGSYTEEENRLLVRKLDWHVSLSTLPRYKLRYINYLH